MCAECWHSIPIPIHIPIPIPIPIPARWVSPGDFESMEFSTHLRDARTTSLARDLLAYRQRRWIGHNGLSPISCAARTGGIQYDGL